MSLRKHSLGILREMVLILSSLVAALFPSFAIRAQTSAGAQDPEKIIGQYAKAVGGAKPLAKVQTLTLEGALVKAGEDRAGTYTFKTKLPNRYYSELVLGDTTLIEAYNGKSAWHQSSNGEIATLLGAEGSQLEAAGHYYNSHLLNAKKTKIGLAFAGTTQVAG